MHPQDYPGCVHVRDYFLSFDMSRKGSTSVDSGSYFSAIFEKLVTTTLVIRRIVTSSRLPTECR